METPTAKHTPQRWDLYRDKSGKLFVLDKIDQGWATFWGEAGEWHLHQNIFEFIGNVLALPELMEKMKYLLQFPSAMHNPGFFDECAQLIQRARTGPAQPAGEAQGKEQVELTRKE